MILKQLFAKKIIIIIVIVALLGVILVLVGCKDGCSLSKAVDQNSSDQIQDSLPKVRVLNLSQVNGQGLSINLSGTVKAQSNVKVVTLSSGQVITINNKVGDDVQAGQVLARLDSPEVATALAAATTALNNAQENILKVQIGTETQVSQAELAVKNAALNVSLAQEVLRNTQGSNQDDLAAAENGVESAKTALAQVENDLENTRSQTEQAMITVINSAQSLYNNQLVFLNNIFRTLDDFMNNSSLQGALSALDQQLKVETQRETKAFLYQLEVFLDGQAVSIVQENLITEFSIINDLLGETHSVLSLIISALNNTVAGSQISPDDLADTKTEYNGLEAQATGNIQIVNGTISGYHSLILQNQSSISQMESLVTQSQIGLQTAEFSLSSLGLKLDSGFEQARTGLRQAENGLDNARSNLKQTLNSRQIQQLAVQSNLDAVRSQYELAKIRHDNTIIDAPISGVVTQKFVELGADVAPGTPLFEVQNIDTLKVSVEVSQIDLENITIGDEVLINKTLSGLVYLVEPILSSGSRKGRVEILYTDTPGQLTVGSLVNVQFPIDGSNGKDSIIIPLKTVEIGDDVSRVRVIEDGKLAWRDVVIGESRNELVEILAGLSDEDILVTAGADFLEIGSEVEIVIE